ncbi:hypothetical protein [uncultured phage MedDCM-OCT-S08-C233]|nr:hypothetical protein [uncultured phage MedDCM-OCT-S08-C233]
MTNARDKANIPVLNFQSKGIDDNSTATAITIDSADEVKIGTTTDSWSGANGLVIKEASGDGGITIVSSSTSSNGNIGFADAENGAFSDMRGLITYLHNGDSFRFMTANAERMRLNSTGLGIGTSSPTETLDVTGTNNSFVKSKTTTSTGIGGFNAFNNSTAQIKLYSYGSSYSGSTFGGVANANIALLESQQVSNVVFSTWSNAGGSNPDFIFAPQRQAKVIIKSNGNVGIGTSSPSQLLHVNGHIVGNSLNIPSNTGSPPSGVTIHKPANNTMAFRTNSSERMRLTDTGLGIGTTSPQRQLHVQGNDGASGTNAGNSDSQIFIDNDGGNGAMIEFGASNNGAGRIMFSDEDATNRGKIEYMHSSDHMQFSTANSERMRITSGGQIWMRTTSTSLTNATQVVFHPGSSEYGIRINSTGTSGTQYHLSFDRGQTQAGYITSNSATTIAVNNSSDERLKENIENSGSALQDIKDLKVRQFDWKDNIDTHRDFGFVAQELHSIIPEAVSVGSDELDDNGKPKQSWGVDYSHIVPRLVKAVQEQQTRIESLEAEVTALKNQP